MNLIERYIFRKAGAAVLVILGSLVGVIWIVQALREVDVITTNSQSIFTYLAITTLAVPNIALAIIPIALLLSAIYTINTMNADSELVVVSVSGLSNWRIAKPIIVLALICSLFTGMVGHFIAPASLQILKNFVTEMRADLVSVIIREGTFNTIDEGLTFHIGKRGAGGILNGILISDDRNQEVSIIYSANEGIVTRIEAGTFLLLKNGHIQQDNREDGSITFINYDSYLFDLSNFSGTTQESPRKARERSTPDLLNPDPNDPTYKSDPGRYRNQIHQRFSEMLWPFAYVFVILAFAGQSRSSRQSFSTSIITASICVIVARASGFSSISALRANPDAIFIVYGLPLFCIFAGAFFVFTNRPVNLPKPVIDQIEIFKSSIVTRLEDFNQQYKAYRRHRAGLET